MNKRRKLLNAKNATKFRNDNDLTVKKPFWNEWGVFPHRPSCNHLGYTKNESEADGNSTYGKRRLLLRAVMLKRLQFNDFGKKISSPIGGLWDILCMHACNLRWNIFFTLKRQPRRIYAMIRYIKGSRKKYWIQEYLRTNSRAPSILKWIRGYRTRVSKIGKNLANYIAIQLCRILHCSSYLESKKNNVSVY